MLKSWWMRDDGCRYIWKMCLRGRARCNNGRNKGDKTKVEICDRQKLEWEVSYNSLSLTCGDAAPVRHSFIIIPENSGLESLKIKLLLENYFYLLEMDKCEWFILFFELTGIGSQIFQDCFLLFITASLTLSFSDL